MLSQSQLVTLFDTLIGQQQTKVLKIAKELCPGITPEDMRNPQDFARLMQHPQFNFEDGILSGYLSAKMAVMAELKSQ